MVFLCFRRLYAFDVHCNSFFPMFVMLYVIHYFVSPLLVAHGFIPELLSNLLFMVAASYYHYLNFLGYDVLPFLERTTFFLYPIGVIIVLSPILILSGFNPSRYFMNMYFSQRVWCADCEISDCFGGCINVRMLDDLHTCKKRRRNAAKNEKEEEKKVTSTFFMVFFFLPSGTEIRTEWS